MDEGMSMFTLDILSQIEWGAVGVLVFPIATGVLVGVLHSYFISDIKSVVR